MKHIAGGIIAGAAVAAAFAGSVTANATGDTWTPGYDVNDAAAFQASGSSSVAWELPATFTHGDTTLSGTELIMPSAGGFNNVFEAGHAVYAQDQLGLGFTNLVYAPGVDGTTPADVIDVLKTPFGDVNMPWAALLVEAYMPLLFANLSPVPSAGLVASDTGLVHALDLGPGDLKDVTWTQDYGTDNAGLLQVVGSSALAWELPDTTFTASNGTVLTGTDWVTQTLYLGQHIYGYDNEFVTNTGALYDQHQLAPDFTNLYYYDPSVSLSAADILQTPFGNFDMSWIAPVFEPMDYLEHAIALSPVTDLTDAGLYSTLDLGLVTP